MSKINPLLQWWFTPKLPKEHIHIKQTYTEGSLRSVIGLYLRRWIAHPIKRRIAKYWLLFLQKFYGLKVIGITGSAGKTSTKEMLYSILSQKEAAVASYKNIDPVYNIPTTILRCRPSTKYLILEMGVEYLGEMDYYLWLAKPSVGILTNVQPTHIEFFKDVETVGKEKSKLVKSLSKNDIAILNIQDTWSKNHLKDIKAQKIWYGEKGDIEALDYRVTNDFKTKFVLKSNNSKIQVLLPTIGLQFVSNSLAAAAAGLACKLSLKDIVVGLGKYTAPDHRMEVKRLKSGALIVDDSYNSNPYAVKKALETFKSISTKKETIAVLGDMLELGNQEKTYHRELGKSIHLYGIDYLIGVGPASKVMVDEAIKKMPKSKCFWTNSVDDALPLLKSLLNNKSFVLIKGSRSVNLDKLVSRLS